MSAWDWIFGLAGIVGLVFAIYTYYKTELAKAIELVNKQVLQEKLQNLHDSLTAALHASDAIVQASKRDTITAQELANMARVLRGFLYVLSKGTDTEVKRLKKWRFGKMIESQSDLEDLQASEESE